MIDIAVCGTATLQRSALNIILEDMERVHATYRELPFKRRVPLPDKPDVDESYEHLLRLENKHGAEYHYEPADADREYSVGELLDGVPRNTGRKVAEGERKTSYSPDVAMSKPRITKTSRLRGVVMTGPRTKKKSTSLDVTLLRSRILFLAVNPTDTTKLRLDEELIEVREELDLSNMRSKFDLQNSGAVRPKISSGHFSAFSLPMFISLVTGRRMEPSIWRTRTVVPLRLLQTRSPLFLRRVGRMFTVFC